MSELRKRKRKLGKDYMNVIDVSDDEVESSNEDSDVEVTKIQSLEGSNLKSSSSCIMVEDNRDSGKLDLDSVPSSQDLFSSQDDTSILHSSHISIADDSDVEFVGSTAETSLSHPPNLNSYQSDAVTSSLDVVHPESIASTSQDSHTGSEFCILDTTCSCLQHAQVKQRLLELEEDLQQLKTENESLRLSCTCRHKHSEIVSETGQELVARVFLNTIENYNIFKNELLPTFQSDLKYDIREKESDFVIEIFKSDIDLNDWVIIDDVDSVQDHNKPTKSKHKKKKKKREKLEKELFVLDTTPVSEAKSSLQYLSKFSVALNKLNDEDEQKGKNSVAACFNCDEYHNLRDCPHPKNYSKINAARQKFKGNQSKPLRYHLEEDQKFSHIKPGVISENLRCALGLRDDQLPVHIYKMRQLGYPPGWFEELQSGQNSKLLLFDFEGKNDFKAQSDIGDVDPDKIVEYTGFNVPLKKGIRDEYKYFGCPQYSRECSKEKMLEYARKLSQKAKDNLESCDMDIEEQASPKVNESGSEMCGSLSLNELENAKKKLLSELIDTNDDSITDCTNEDTSFNGLKTLDISGDECNITGLESNPNSPFPNSPSPSVNKVKVSRFGTPILTSLSPYSKLPKPENFQQDVSDVINFENLPNSTGKYEQLVGVLDKVRVQLKRLSSLQ